MDKRFELEIKDILEKEFHIDLKGYCANEVDTFLDCVIADYQQYEESIKNLGENLRKYDEENNNLREKVKELELALQGKEVNHTNINNVDIIKRLSKLEQEVFKK